MGGVKQRKRAIAAAAKLFADAGAKVTPALEPLRCPKCSAPVPLGDGDVATCSFCSAQVPVPEAYRAMRDAERGQRADRAAAEKLYAELSKPSRALEMWVTFTTISGGLVMTIAFAILALSAVFMFLAGFALELFLHWIAPLIGIDVIDRLGGGTTYAVFAIGLVVLVLFPIWLDGYLHTAGEIRKALQTSLAARPPERSGFPSTCRLCGAALDVPAGALGVRCAYCEADNLVALPRDVVAAAGARQQDFHKSIVEAAERARALRAEARAGLPKAARSCAIFVVVFGLVGRGCTSLDMDQGDLPTWSNSMGPPRILARPADREHGEPMNTDFGLGWAEYVVALHRHEVIEIDDDIEPMPATFSNMTTFPLITRSWEMESKPKPGGGYRGHWRAPYTGLFYLKLGGTNMGGHLQWRLAR
jgi:LSD1 subclass zinc finger protein